MQKVIFGILVFVAVLALVGCGFAGGFFTGSLTSSHNNDIISPIPSGNQSEETPASEPGETIDFDIIQEVLNILVSNFYGELPDAKTMAYGAIRGMLLTLDDPYTSFIEPKIAAILNEDASGEFEGIGATVRMREDGYLEIVRPLPGHPAEAAGLLAGDLILAVDGESIVGMGLYEALGLIRGPADSEVVLEIGRPEEGDTFTVAITRARIALPIVEYEMLDDNIAYVRLTEFDNTASDRVKAALEELQSQNPQGLIFDLRDNPGGYLSEAIKVSDIFLDEGLIAIERDSEDNEQRFYSYDGDVGEDILMVVLVNGGSASASEIVAGALQDRQRAMLIGETTVGKGSVQLPHNLSDGSQFRVTIAHWFTPDEQAIHGNGLTPDIEAPYPTDTPVDQDPQRDRAIEYLLQGQ
jgi:carboxyl-terminal processing protease